MPPPGTLCAPLDCGGDAVPTAVGPALTLAIESATDIRLIWPGVPGAASYRVWRSADPQFATAEKVGSSTSTDLLIPGGVADPLNWYYRVRAVNSCEWEGP